MCEIEFLTQIGSDQFTLFGRMRLQLNLALIWRSKAEAFRRIIGGKDAQRSRDTS
jgi:hypothetical protein